MSSDVTRDGVRGARPGREATTGVNAAPAEARRRSRKRTRGGEEAMVPAADFRSYYGTPVLNPPVWKRPDVPAYLFLGGLAGGSSLLGAGAHLTGRSALATRTKLTAVLAAAASGAALVHDLGRPARFLNMLRTFKPTSPMSLGSWLLAAYGPAAGVAALSAVSGRARRLGAVSTAGSAALAPAVAAYTAALLSDTAVPAWHEASRELPFVFVGSAAAAAGGTAMVLVPVGEAVPARRLAVAGWLAEAVSTETMTRRLGMIAEPYEHGRGGLWLRAGKVLGLLGAAGAALGGRRRAVGVASGAALVAASVCTRAGVFEAGMESARDPRYTVVPQRERLDAG